MDQWNKPLLGNRIDPEHPLSRGLVGYWLMNEGSGDRIYDLSGNGNEGVFGGNPLWKPGQRGQSIDFDGIADYIDCGNASSLNITNMITIAAWINLTTTNAELILSNFKIGVTSGGYNVEIQAAKVRLILRTQTNALICDLLSLSDLGAEQLKQIVMTYNGSVANIYIDGKVNNSVACSGLIGIPGDPVLIGWLNGVGRYLDGFILSVMIWNRGLSAQEVLELYINPYEMIWSPKVYSIPAGAVRKFTAEHIDTHFIAEV